MKFKTSIVNLCLYIQAVTDKPNDGGRAHAQGSGASDKSFHNPIILGVLRYVHDVQIVLTFPAAFVLK